MLDLDFEPRACRSGPAPPAARRARRHRSAAPAAPRAPAPAACPGRARQRPAAAPDSAAVRTRRGRACTGCAGRSRAQPRRWRRGRQRPEPHARAAAVRRSCAPAARRAASRCSRAPPRTQRDPAAFDALVLQRLLGWLAAHRAAWNSQPTSFTVNLSIATLEDERFAQKIAATLNTPRHRRRHASALRSPRRCARSAVRRSSASSPSATRSAAWVVIDDFSFDSQVLPLLRSKALRLVKIDSKLSSSALKDKLSPGDGGRHRAGGQGARHPLRGQEGRLAGRSCSG